MISLYLFSYNYESWSLSAYPVYVYWHQSGFGKDIPHKSILDYIVDVESFLYKESNKLNIFQELEYISACRLDLKSFSSLAKKSKTKPILMDE